MTRHRLTRIAASSFVILCLAWLLSAAAVNIAQAQDKQLVLGVEGTTNYQIVLPDQAASDEIDQCLFQAARLVQAAFKSNSLDLPIVKESQRDAKRPGIFLGDTALAREQGIQQAQHHAWGYVHRVVGQNVIITGRDESTPGKISNPAAPTWPRLGTVKAVADFLREYVGTRFLMLDVPLRSGVLQLAKVDLLNSSAFEFLPMSIIVVPANLNVTRTPAIEYSNAWAAGAGFEEIANCRFPIVDEVFGGHTWARAVPEDKYYQDHPEYFALVNGKRLGGMGASSQYCISNKDVQEMIYQDALRWLDAGYNAVDLGQPDGFRPCQCEECKKLFDTGNDWNEKIWILHRNVAQRIAESRPGKIVVIYSYIQTGNPPRSFKTLPSNVRVALTGTEEHELGAWRAFGIPPQGFSAYVYNWTANLTTPYHPMRTPLYVEEQARRLAKLNFHSIQRDGRGDLWGLEGPTYYVMGRMFDDPMKLHAKDLVSEYCGAAFGTAAPNMLRFYNELYHAIELYSQYLATRAPGWAYSDIFGRGKKHLTDPFPLIAFLYPPSLLQTLEKELSSAEAIATSPKVQARLALVRREFEWVRDLAISVHLYQAYQVQPDAVMRNRVLDALDVRNANVAAMFETTKYKGPKQIPGLAVTTFPPMGHSEGHLLLNYDGYQTPYKSTFVNWDTRAMRKAPLANAKTLSLKPLNGSATDATAWKSAAAGELSAIASDVALKAKTSVRAAYDASNLYLRVEAQLPAGKADEQEAVEIYLWPPNPDRDVSYRFVVTPGNKKIDAANGLVTDAMDPRYGQYDPDWEGKWASDVQVDAAAGRWTTLVTIPFATLGAGKPDAGVHWRGNIGRVNVIEPGKVQRSLWSASSSAQLLDDRNEFGELVFESSAAAADVNPQLKWRMEYNAKSFDFPPAWKSLPDQLSTPLTGWKFRPDSLEQGIKGNWFKPEAPLDGWLDAIVPAFWAEIPGVGDYQGYGWYRVTFTVPEAWKGRPVAINFASIDEQAWVYFNGQMIREHTTTSENKSLNDLWEEPFTATVPPPMVNYGKPNVLVVRVLNAISNGGIWRGLIINADAK